MRTPPSLAASVLVAASLLPLAWAGPGHDHDHDHAATAPAGPALPRFAAVSELFEMVGVLEGRRIVLYLDRSADNAPVVGAKIELEVAGAKLAVEQHDDTYDVMLPADPKPGVLPITATVTAGSDVDLLAGELEIAQPAPADQAPQGPSWKAVAAGSAGAVLTLLGLVLVLTALWRQRRASRRAGTGVAA